MGPGKGLSSHAIIRIQLKERIAIFWRFFPQMPIPINTDTLRKSWERSKSHVFIRIRCWQVLDLLLFWNWLFDGLFLGLAGLLGSDF